MQKLVYGEPAEVTLPPTGREIPSSLNGRFRARKNGRARGRHARGEGAFRAGAPSPLPCLPLACPFFLAPTTSFWRRLQSIKQRNNAVHYNFLWIAVNCLIIISLVICVAELVTQLLTNYYSCLHFWVSKGIFVTVVSLKAFYNLIPRA